MARVLSWPKKTVQTLREKGPSGLAKKINNLAGEARFRINEKKSNDSKESFIDVLFINGCSHTVPHPIRYRVEHQREQLEANGMTTDTIFYHDITLDDTRRARNFIFFRCPFTNTVGEFIKKAKELNKKVYFDIDDLVIDTKYTDTIKYLDTMEASEREGYDRCVQEIGQTLRLCDGAITTTEALARELSDYVSEVFVNRNTASEDMLKLSEEALYQRDVLPNIPKEQVPPKRRAEYRNLQNKLRLRDEQLVFIGYFSGSITHNEDFEMILPALCRVLDERANTRLHVVGELDLPQDLEPYRERVVFSNYSSWKRLPSLIAQVDINLAPLTESIFNEAKSENKWVEASLVKTATVASDLGAFAKMIAHNETGLLCKSSDDWYAAILKLVDDADYRTLIAQNAYEYCQEHCLTISSGYSLAEFIKKRQTPNIAVVLSLRNISGGILVILKHCSFLHQAGYDVFLLNEDDEYTWYEFEGHAFPVIDRVDSLFDHVETPVKGRIDHAVATFWSTLEYLEKYPSVDKVSYLIQNFEVDFYKPKDPFRKRANATYSKDKVFYLTISQWCKRWLEQDYGRTVRYASNGLDTKKFWPMKRNFGEKIRILIEGDYSLHKNVDESFKIVDKLDPERFEVWYMSYMPKPKSFYKIDKFLGAVPHDEVADVYRECHILIKTSLLESFSYPPLEMMSTGGFVLALPNEGNEAYLRDAYNCLLYPPGDLDAAVDAIHRICGDAELREQLYAGGVETASRYNWECLKDDICSLYE